MLVFTDAEALWSARFLRAIDVTTRPIDVTTAGLLTQFYRSSRDRRILVFYHRSFKQDKPIQYGCFFSHTIVTLNEGIKLVPNCCTHWSLSLYQVWKILSVYIQTQATSEVCFYCQNHMGRFISFDYVPNETKRIGFNWPRMSTGHQIPSKWWTNFQIWLAQKLLHSRNHGILSKDEGHLGCYHKIQFNTFHYRYPIRSNQIRSQTAEYISS